LANEHLRYSARLATFTLLAQLYVDAFRASLQDLSFSWTALFLLSAHPIDRSELLPLEALRILLMYLVAESDMRGATW
jgi:hypothetical protein